MGVNESAFCRTADEVYCDIYQKLVRNTQSRIKLKFNDLNA